MPIDFASLWDFANPAASEARFRTLLDDPSVRDPLDRAEILTQLGRSLGLQHRFDEADRTLDDAAPLIGAAPCRAAIRLALERGRVLNTSGRPADAAPHFHHARDQAEALGEDALAVDALHMLAIVERDDDALGWNLRALCLAESSRDPSARRWIASLRNNIGWWYHERGRFAEALEQFRIALRERQQHGIRAPLLVAQWAVARCLRSLGRADEALGLQCDLAAAHARDGTDDGYVHEEIAECLVMLGRTADAAPHFRRALELLGSDPTFADLHPERARRLEQLGRSTDR